MKKSDAPPNAPLKVAVVGAGFISRFHLDALLDLPVKIVAVVDRDSTLAKAAADHYGVEHHFVDVSSMIDEVEPDAAHVLVPPPMHEDVATTLLKRGVSIFLEKPMTVDLESADRLLAVAEESGTTIGVNHNQVFDPTYQRLKERVASGAVGNVSHVSVRWHLPLRQLMAGDYGNWIFAETGNIVYEQAVHPFSQVYDLLGSIRCLSAMRRGRHDLPHGVPFFDTWQLSMDCERGTATVSLAFGDVFPESSISVTGTDGTVSADLTRGLVTGIRKSAAQEVWDRFALVKANVLAQLRVGAGQVLEHYLAIAKLAKKNDFFTIAMRKSIKEFHEALRERRPVPFGGRDARGVLVYGDELLRQFESTTTPDKPKKHIFRELAEGDILVTGATGFIGRHLVEQLLADGQPVRILARSRIRIPKHWAAANVALIEGTVDDVDAVDVAVQGCRAVFHLATAASGTTYEEIRDSMVGACCRLGDACVRYGVGHLLYTSSIAALYLGETQDGPVKDSTPVDDKPEGRMTYARCKILAEEALSELRERRGLLVTVFRPGVVVGEGGLVQHSGIGKWMRNTHCLGWGDGTTVIPFVLVGDVVKAMVNSLGLPDTIGRTYNLVGDTAVTASDYVEALRVKTGRDFQFVGRSINRERIVVLAKWVFKHAIRYPTRGGLPSYRERKTKALRRRFDVSTAKRDLNWTPVSDSGEFLAQALDWYAAIAKGHNPDAEISR